MTGENTELKYVFEDGWSVEVHGSRTVRDKDHAEWHVTTFAIVNSLHEEVYEGEFSIQPHEVMDPIGFFRVMCGVIFGLKQDYWRYIRPHKYDEHDRGLVIVDERIRLWLTMSDIKMFDLALNEIAGTSRTGRTYYSKGKFERARTVG